MHWKTEGMIWLAALALVAAVALPVHAQQQTGAITGRATDGSGGALPGVTVSITSPNMIGGARTAITDEQGVYRFTLLPGGQYVVSFTLPGFTTLNVEGVGLNAGPRRKRFKTFGNQSVEGIVDLFNSLNTNTITNQTNRNGSTYLQPTEIIAPRVFRLGVRYRF